MRLFGRGKPANPDVCPLCEGTQHVEISKDVFETCSCQIERLRKEMFLGLKLTPSIWDATWKEVSDRHKNEAARLRIVLKDTLSRKRNNVTVILWGGGEKIRRDLATLFMRDAIKEDRVVQAQDLLTVVEASFDAESRQLHHQILESDFFWLRMEIGPTHRWNPVVLDKILEGRNAREKPATLVTYRYGKEALLNEYPTIPAFESAEEIRL